MEITSVFRYPSSMSPPVRLAGERSHVGNLTGSLEDFIELRDCQYLEAEDGLASITAFDNSTTNSLSKDFP